MRFVLFALLCGCGSSAPSLSEAGEGDGEIPEDAPVFDSPSDAPKDSPADASMSDSSADAGPGTYTAYALIGGLDRLRIVKTVGGTCFMLQLVSPSQMSGGLTLPSMWGFEMAEALQPAQACDPKYAGPITNSYMATSASGSVNFLGPQIPQTVTSVMATLTFANNPNWCPPSEQLSTTNLPVQ